MRKQMWKKMIGVVAGLTLVLSGAALALGPNGGGESGGPKMLAHLSAELALTEVQSEQILATFETGEADRVADRERLQELRDELHALESDFDAGTVQSIADEIGAITTRSVYARAAIHAQVYEILTDEQRELLDEKKAERVEHRSFARDFHHSRIGGR